MNWKRQQHKNQVNENHKLTGTQTFLGKGLRLGTFLGNGGDGLQGGNTLSIVIAIASGGEHRHIGRKP